MIILARNDGTPPGETVRGPSSTLHTTWRFTRRGWHIAGAPHTSAVSACWHALVVDDDGCELAALVLEQSRIPHPLAHVLPATINRLPVLQHPLTWHATHMRLAESEAAPIAASPTCQRVLTGMFTGVLAIALTRAVSLHTPGFERILVCPAADPGDLGMPFEYAAPQNTGELFASAAAALNGISDKELLMELRARNSGAGAGALAAIAEILRRETESAGRPAMAKRLERLQRTLLLAQTAGSSLFTRGFFAR